MGGDGSERSDNKRVVLDRIDTVVDNLEPRRISNGNVDNASQGIGDLYNVLMVGNLQYASVDVDVSIWEGKGGKNVLGDLWPV